jgi:hypothetical protein
MRCMICEIFFISDDILPIIQKIINFKSSSVDGKSKGRQVKKNF